MAKKHQWVGEPPPKTSARAADKIMRRIHEDVYRVSYQLAYYDLLEGEIVSINTRGVIICIDPDDCIFASFVGYCSLTVDEDGSRTLENSEMVPQLTEGMKCYVSRGKDAIWTVAEATANEEKGQRNTLGRRPRRVGGTPTAFVGGHIRYH